MSKELVKIYPMEKDERAINDSFARWQTEVKLLFTKRSKDVRLPLIFIHVPRTAGISFGASFERKHQLTHWPAAVIRDRLGDELYNKYKSVSVVRNTWDRLVSLYSFMKKNNPQIIIFEEFIYNIDQYFWTISQLFFLCDGPVSSDISRFTDKTASSSSDQFGKIIVDNIVKFETLDRDFELLGFNSMPKLNQSDHKHYSHYYDDDTKKIVQDRYQDEIQRFGFTFENRKKNYEN